MFVCIGNTIKLREHPLELQPPNNWRNPICGQGNDLGYGKNVEDWTIRSQVLNQDRTRIYSFTAFLALDAVHRLDVGG
jgi:hypothetical protein